MERLIFFHAFNRYILLWCKCDFFVGQKDVVLKIISFFRSIAFFHCSVMVMLALAVYSNNYHHAYHLDSGHLILENSAVRSLKNIPLYFYDPSTLSTLRSNIDYRPVLQITYALNYCISGYDTWSWHLLQILLHAVCALGLYTFCVRLMAQFEYGRRTAAWTAFIAALLFTLHPTASGVVNYLSARSSLLTAAFLLPAFCAYLRSPGHPHYRAASYGAAALYCLALFTKVEAVGALPVFFFYDVLQTARNPEDRRRSPFRDFLSTVNRAEAVRLLPFFISTIVYFVIRCIVMTGFDTGARHDAQVTSFVYLVTQLTAWWHYVSLWFAPVHLVADTMNYPVFRSLFDPQVMLALGGWGLVAAITRMTYSHRPYILFIALAAVSLIAPTSSLSPLAEMVNEHRPYLPIALLSCAWTIPLVPLCFSFFKNCRSGAMIGAFGFCIVLVALFAMTWQRNKVFSTQKAYYQDILNKAPSARAYANYGQACMTEGNYAEALRYYLKALEMAPNWHIVHINLGLIYQAQGNDSLARSHFDQGVATDLYSATARIYRGEYFLARSRYPEAMADFEQVLPLNRDKYRIWKGAATAASGLGQWQKALLYCKQCHAADPSRIEFDMVAISRPYWDRPDLCSAGSLFYTSIDTLLPDRWWVHHNLGDLAARCGNVEKSQRELSLAQKLKAR